MMAVDIRHVTLCCNANSFTNYTNSTSNCKN